MDWYYRVRDDDPLSPVTDAQLWQLVSDGEVPPLASVRRGESGPWHFAAELRALLEAESPSRPPRPRSRLPVPALVALGVAGSLFLACVISLGQSEPKPAKTPPFQYIVIEEGPTFSPPRITVGPHPGSLPKSQRPAPYQGEWPGGGVLGR